MDSSKENRWSRDLEQVNLKEEFIDSPECEDAVLILSYEGELVVVTREDEYKQDDQATTESVHNPDAETIQIKEDLKDVEVQHNFEESEIHEVKEEEVFEGENTAEFEKQGNALEEKVNKAKSVIQESDLPLEVFERRAGNIFRCCFCRQKVKTQPSLRSHILRHLKNGSIRKCRYCDFMTAVTQTLHEHEWKHTNWRPYKCPNCPFRCRLKSDLGKHRATHSYYKKFSCHLCSYRTKWRSSLTYHLDRHSDVRTLPHACRQCGQAFKFESGLRHHLRQRHTDVKPLQCDQCPFRCKTKYELNYHKTSHSDYRPFACKFPGCKRACKTKSDFTKHMKIHINARNHVCDLCGKGFKFVTSLKKHATVHSQERNFECQICRKKFKTIAALRQHNLLHQGLKPYRCDVCLKAYSNRNNLLHHKQVHEGERPFKCPICVYGGREMEHLLLHIGSEHLKDFTYVCSICHKPFGKSHNLQVHLKKCHKEKMTGKIDALVYKPQYLDINLQPEYEKQFTHLISGSDQGRVAGSSCSISRISQGHAFKKRESQSDWDSSSSELVGVPQTPDTHLKEEFESSSSAKASDYPPVIQIGTYGGVGFCVARKGSGFVFNLNKRGKKPNKWFMALEHMTPVDAKRHKAFLRRKEREFVLSQNRRRKPSFHKKFQNHRGKMLPAPNERMVNKSKRSLASARNDKPLNQRLAKESKNNLNKQSQLGHVCIAKRRTRSQAIAGELLDQNESDAIFETELKKAVMVSLSETVQKNKKQGHGHSNEEQPDKVFLSSIQRETEQVLDSTSQSSSHNSSSTFISKADEIPMCSGASSYPASVLDKAIDEFCLSHASDVGTAGQCSLAADRKNCKKSGPKPIAQVLTNGGRKKQLSKTVATEEEVAIKTAKLNQHEVCMSSSSDTTSQAPEKSEIPLCRVKLEPLEFGQMWAHALASQVNDCVSETQPLSLVNNTPQDPTQGMSWYCARSKERGLCSVRNRPLLEKSKYLQISLPDICTSPKVKEMLLSQGFIKTSRKVCHKIDATFKKYKSTSGAEKTHRETLGIGGLLVATAGSPAARRDPKVKQMEKKARAFALKQLKIQAMGKHNSDEKQRAVCKRSTPWSLNRCPPNDRVVRERVPKVNSVDGGKNESLEINSDVFDDEHFTCGGVYSENLRNLQENLMVRTEKDDFCFIEQRKENMKSSSMLSLPVLSESANDVNTSTEVTCAKKSRRHSVKSRQSKQKHESENLTLDFVVHETDRCGTLPDLPLTIFSNSASTLSSCDRNSSSPQEPTAENVHKAMCLLDPQRNTHFNFYSEVKENLPSNTEAISNGASNAPDVNNDTSNAANLTNAFYSSASQLECNLDVSSVVISHSVDDRDSTDAEDSQAVSSLKGAVRSAVSKINSVPTTRSASTGVSHLVSEFLRKELVIMVTPVNLKFSTAKQPQSKAAYDNTRSIHHTKREICVHKQGKSPKAKVSHHICDSTYVTSVAQKDAEFSQKQSRKSQDTHEPPSHSPSSAPANRLARRKVSRKIVLSSSCSSDTNIKSCVNDSMMNCGTASGALPCNEKSSQLEPLKVKYTTKKTNNQTDSDNSKDAYITPVTRVKDLLQICVENNIYNTYKEDIFSNVATLAEDKVSVQKKLKKAKIKTHTRTTTVFASEGLTDYSREGSEVPDLRATLHGEVRVSNECDGHPQEKSNMAVLSESGKQKTQCSKSEKLFCKNTHLTAGMKVTDSLKSKECPKPPKRKGKFLGLESDLKYSRLSPPLTAEKSSLGPFMDKDTGSVASVDFSVTEVSHAKKVGRPAKKVGRPAKKVGRPAKKTDTPTKKMDTPAKKADISVKNTNTPTKKADISVKNANTPTKKADTPAKKMDTAAKKADTPAKKMDTPTKKTDISVKTADTPKKMDSPTKKVDTPAKMMERTVRKVGRPPKNKVLPSNQSSHSSVDDTQKIMEGTSGERNNITEGSVLCVTKCSGHNSGHVFSKQQNNNKELIQNSQSPSSERGKDPKNCVHRIKKRCTAKLSKQLQPTIQKRPRRGQFHRNEPEKSEVHNKGKRRSVSNAASGKTTTVQETQRINNSAFKIIKPCADGKILDSEKAQEARKKKKYMYVERDLGTGPDQLPVIKRRPGRPPRPKVILDCSQTNLCFPLQESRNTASIPLLVPEPSETSTVPEVDVIDESVIMLPKFDQEFVNGETVTNNVTRSSHSPPVLAPEPLIILPPDPRCVTANVDSEDSDVEYVGADYVHVDLSAQQLPLHPLVSSSQVLDMPCELFQHSSTFQDDKGSKEFLVMSHGVSADESACVLQSSVRDAVAEGEGCVFDRSSFPDEHISHCQSRDETLRSINACGAKEEIGESHTEFGISQTCITSSTAGCYDKLEKDECISIMNNANCKKEISLNNKPSSSILAVDQLSANVGTSKHAKPTRDHAGISLEVDITNKNKDLAFGILPGGEIGEGNDLKSQETEEESLSHEGAPARNISVPDQEREQAEITKYPPSRSPAFSASDENINKCSTIDDLSEKQSSSIQSACLKDKDKMLSHRDNSTEIKNGMATNLSVNSEEEITESRNFLRDENVSQCDEEYSCNEKETLVYCSNDQKLSHKLTARNHHLCEINLKVGSVTTNDSTTDIWSNCLQDSLATGQHLRIESSASTSKISRENLWTVDASQIFATCEDRESDLKASSSPVSVITDSSESCDGSTEISPNEIDASTNPVCFSECASRGKFNAMEAILAEGTGSAEGIALESGDISLTLDRVQDQGHQGDLANIDSNCQFVCQTQKPANDCTVDLKNPQNLQEASFDDVSWLIQEAQNTSIEESGKSHVAVSGEYHSWQGQDILAPSHSLFIENTPSCQQSVTAGVQAPESTVLVNIQAPAIAVWPQGELRATAESQLPLRENAFDPSSMLTCCEGQMQNLSMAPTTTFLDRMGLQEIVTDGFGHFSFAAPAPHGTSTFLHGNPSVISISTPHLNSSMQIGPGLQSSPLISVSQALPVGTVSYSYPHSPAVTSQQNLVSYQPNTADILWQACQEIVNTSSAINLAEPAVLAQPCNNTMVPMPYSQDTQCAVDGFYIRQEEAVVRSREAADIGTGQLSESHQRVVTLPDSRWRGAAEETCIDVSDEDLNARDRTHLHGQNHDYSLCLNYHNERLDSAENQYGDFNVVPLCLEADEDCVHESLPSLDCS
ncbi:uncharacterized protein LOC112553321 isoform X1 [Pomacea canaliculata]|uniref:uncharacterized protein LOC112553321 isoform X1 n=1 Tax=Pomacea canaliculata TaxID=400727 RepID=UPI000D73846E|nr:uncharacterized protein LOC112553321 isoform X1 [Pomacea canaliculata]